MSRYDKIIALFEKYGALSTEAVTNYLKKDFGINKDKRTIQRDITVLVHDKKLLVPNPRMDKEQTYSLVDSGKTWISDYFLSKYWNELFEVRRELINPNRPFLNDPIENLFDTYFKLYSLAIMLPKSMKDKIMPSVKALREFKRKEPDGYDIFFMEIEKIIDRISTMLHEAQTNR